MTPLPTHDQLQQIEGEVIRVNAPFLDAPAPLTLAEVSPLQSDDYMECFSLVLTSEVSACLPQEIYQVYHDALGEHELYMAPLGPKGDLMQYQIIFQFLKGQP